MGYLSDWNDAAEHSARVRAAHPNCDESVNCTAGPIKYAPEDDGHTLGCRWRRAEHKRLLADKDVVYVCVVCAVPMQDHVWENCPANRRPESPLTEGGG